MDYSEIKAAYDRLYARDQTAQRLAKLIGSGKGDYATAARYAEAVGRLWSQALTRAVSGLEALELEQGMAWIRPALLRNYLDVAELSGVVQKNLNTAAGIGMNAALPEANTERITNLITKLCGGPLEDTKWLLGDSEIRNYSRSAVTDTLEANAALQSEAGLKSYIRRDDTASCCDWCASLAGTYEYGQQPEDFFKVHKDCTCTITFMPAKRSWQRINYTTQRDGTINKVTKEIG